MQINSDFEFIIKLIIIGDSGVGKTNFIFRFTEGKFSPLHASTVGLDSKSKIIRLPKLKKNVKIQMWDTAGQERYMAINKNLFHKVQGIIVMYDLTNRDSFENIKSWFNLIKQATSNKTIILIANKLDLAKEERIVSESEGEKNTKENDIMFFEGSGSTGENIDKIFIKIAETIYTNLIEEKNDEKKDASKFNLNKNNNKKKKFC